MSNFDNNNNNNINDLSLDVLKAQLNEAETAAELAEVEAELANDRAETIRQAIQRHQTENRTAQANAFEIRLPGGAKLVMVSANDPRMDNPFPAGSTIVPKQTAAAGSR